MRFPSRYDLNQEYVKKWTKGARARVSTGVYQKLVCWRSSWGTEKKYSMYII